MAYPSVPGWHGACPEWGLHSLLEGRGARGKRRPWGVHLQRLDALPLESSCSFGLWGPACLLRGRSGQCVSRASLGSAGREAPGPEAQRAHFSWQVRGSRMPSLGPAQCVVRGPGQSQRGGNLPAGVRPRRLSLGLAAGLFSALSLCPILWGGP